MNKWRLWALPLSMVYATAAFASLPVHELASLHAQLSFEYAKAGQYGLALESANRSLALDEHLVPAWLARAYIESSLTQDADAERDYLQALRLGPLSAQANNNYGQFLCSRSRVQEAMPYLRQALLDPLYAEPHVANVNLGNCSRKLSQDEQAKDYFLAALRHAPEYEPALKALASLYLEQGSVKLASYYYDRLIQYAETMGPDDLLVGVKLARMSGDRVREARYAALLQSRYPDSKETQQLLSGT